MDGFNEFGLASALIDFLKASPYVETRMVGGAPWFRIKWAEVFLKLKHFPLTKSGPLSPLTEGYKVLSEVGERERPKKKKYHPRWKLFTSMLSGSIMKVRKLNKASNTKMWPTHFRMLHENDGVPIDRIRKTLNWYCEKLVRGGDLIRSNPEFIPICYTAEKFRAKYHQVEGSMERLKGRFGETEEASKKVIRKTLLKSKKRETENDFGI